MQAKAAHGLTDKGRRLQARPGRHRLGRRDSYLLPRHLEPLRDVCRGGGGGFVAIGQIEEMEPELPKVDIEL